MAEHAPAPRWAPRLTLPLAVAGLGLSAYLAYVHYAEPKSLSCPDTGVINCTKVTTSPQSMLFGHIPVAVAGTVYFLVLAFLLLPRSWRSRRKAISTARLAGAVGGVGMVFYLVYVEAVVVHALCLYCTAVHAIMFLLFVAILAAVLLPPLPDDR